MAVDAVITATALATVSVPFQARKGPGDLRDFPARQAPLGLLGLRVCKGCRASRARKDLKVYPAAPALRAYKGCKAPPA